MNPTSLQRASNFDAKLTPKTHSGPLLLADYSCKQGKGFIITLNTPIQKLDNHFVYGDRIQKILHEVHQLYEEAHHKQTLIQTIKLPLGDQQLLLNDNALVKDVFPIMIKLKNMQIHPNTNKKYSSKIFFQVTWKGSPIITTVKCSYVRQYEPQIYAQYNLMRRKFSDKWKAYLKQISPTLKNKSRKRPNESLDEGDEWRIGRKIVKVEGVQEYQEDEDIRVNENSAVKEHDSTEDNEGDQGQSSDIRGFQEIKGRQFSVNTQKQEQNGYIPRQNVPQPLQKLQIIKSPIAHITRPIDSLSLVKFSLSQSKIKTEKLSSSEIRIFKSGNQSYSNLNSSDKLTQKPQSLQDTKHPQTSRTIIEIDDD